jgi:hypothetical protein
LIRDWICSDPARKPTYAPWIQFFNGADIMNDLFFVARLVQGLLAVAIVSAIVAAIQFSLVLA